MMPDFPTPPGEGPGQAHSCPQALLNSPGGTSTQLPAEAGHLWALPSHPLTHARQTGIFLASSCQPPPWMLFYLSARELGVCASVGPSSRPLWSPWPTLSTCTSLIWCPQPSSWQPPHRRQATPRSWQLTPSSQTLLRVISPLKDP